ncbi:hypothetical protein ABS71_18340 [bacterium SCN 62-11]|nr:hypothetical protein [Candidatus Eremiobacteraeota bacterium]ODT58892.1 MAG: hypothetical protein ABS71_18340 [bacterium SCN 62-11]
MKKLLMFVCLSGFAGFPSTAVAAPVVVGLADGLAGNRFPWSTTGGMRWQQVFSAAELTGFVGQNLDQIAYQTVQGATGYTISSLVISVSTSNNAPGSLSSIFANNIGSDNTVVFNQANVTVGANSSSGGFDFALPFTTPFLYTGGDLLIDVLAGGSSSAATFFRANGSAVTTERVYSSQGSPGDAGGTATSNGTLVTQLNFTAAGAPELHPGGAVLPLTFAALSCLIFSRRRRISY